MPIYMKFEGIVGPVQGKHAEWIALESCQFGSSGRRLGSDSTSDKSRVSDISITKRQDTASTALFREAMSGTGRKVIIDFVNNEGVAYMTLELENTMISSMGVSGGHNADALESLTLNFTNISFSTKAAAPAADADPQNTQALWNLGTP